MRPCLNFLWEKWNYMSLYCSDFLSQEDTPQFSKHSRFYPAPPRPKELCCTILQITLNTDLEHWPHPAISCNKFRLFGEKRLRFAFFAPAISCNKFRSFGGEEAVFRHFCPTPDIQEMALQQTNDSAPTFKQQMMQILLFLFCCMIVAFVLASHFFRRSPFLPHTRHSRNGVETESVVWDEW